MAIVVVFFFGTLRVQDWWDRPLSLDHIRTNHIRQIKAALDAYRAQTGHYPAPFLNNPLTDIQPLIPVALPGDPRGGVDEYRYVSDNGLRYGILFHLQGGAGCIAGVAFEGTQWWNNVPACK
jgi:hypothetical protein